MPSSTRFLLLVASLSATPACLYRAGANLTAGVLDEAQGDGKSDGLDGVVERVVRKELAKQLGAQLGEGLMNGVGEVRPGQKASLEDAVDAIVQAATRSAGYGVRDDLAPEVQRMLKEDVIAVLSEGLKGDIGTSLEVAAARSTEAILMKVREHVDDPALRESLGDLFRDAIYIAMREGGRAPAVGDTIEATLSDNMLTPFERSISGIADVVADRVDEGNKGIEQMMQGIISALVVIVGVFALLYGLTRRQLNRAREDQASDVERYRAMSSALQIVDDETRQKILAHMANTRPADITLPGKTANSPAPSIDAQYARNPPPDEPST